MNLTLCGMLVLQQALPNKLLERKTCLPGNGQVWWVDLGWLPHAHPAALTPPPQHNGERKCDGEAHGLRERRGDHLPITVMGKTDST